MAHDPKSLDLNVTFDGDMPQVSIQELQLIEGQLADLVKAVLVQGEEEER